MQVSKYTEAPWRRFGNNRGTSTENPDDLPEEQKPGVRYRPLFKGTPGVPGNFEMVVLFTPSADSGRHFPRHRHNFDQLRYTINGNPEWAPGHPTPPGSLVYTPAGTYYGPYDRHAGEEQLHVQFEGANGAPFVDYDTLLQAQMTLAKRGTFEKGVYTWEDEQGQRHSVDGHQASIEYATGRPEEFPAPRFPASIQMDPDSFSWTELEPGLRFKQLASFTERETRLAVIELSGHVSYRISSAEQTTLLFVTEGEGETAGRQIEKRDGLILYMGEEGIVSTTTSLELLLLALPKLPTNP
jgi:hypothetical protein